MYWRVNRSGDRRFFFKNLITLLALILPLLAATMPPAGPIAPPIAREAMGGLNMSERGLRLQPSSPRTVTETNFSATLPSDVCDSPPNPIVSENCLPGTDGWYLDTLLDDIEGFASSTSANIGETISFYVNTDAERYDLLIYRSGYYGGSGGRLVSTVSDLPGQKQPSCHIEHATGLTSCSNWSPSYELHISEEWVTGIYLGKLVRHDTGGENLIYFVVRDDNRDTDVLFQQSVTTYQAYNSSGAKSLYSSITDNSCLTVAEAPRAVKVSFDRPNDIFPFGPNSYFWTDFPMVYWLEAQGYDVGYATNVDTHIAGTDYHYNELLDHRLFLSVGHDEYWSQSMRDAVTEARDTGTNLGFFSSNVSYWRIRLEADPWSGEPDRVIAAYKTTESGAPDPSGHPTTTWRDPNGANDPENSLIGSQYIGDNDVHYFPIRVTAEQAKDRVYRHTPLQDMLPGDYADIGAHLVGWEWDAVVDNGRSPAGVQVLAKSPTSGSLLTDAGRTYQLGTAEAHVSRYTAASGATVFAAGTNQWSWGLAIFEPDTRIQQITFNLFADMGVLPATPADTLVIDDGPPSGMLPHSVIELSMSDTLIKNVEDSLTHMGAELQLASGGSDVTDGPTPSSGYAELLIENLDIKATDTAISITWETAIPTRAQAWLKNNSGSIDFKLSAETGWRLPVVAARYRENFQRRHEFTLSGLDPGTAYYLQIGVTDEFGRATVSPEKYIETSAGSLIGLGRLLLRSRYRSLHCEFRANLLTIGVAVGIAILAVVSIVFRLLRRKRSGVAPDRMGS